MSELSAKLAGLKSGRKTTEVLEFVKVSRQTFRRIERGESVKLSTLKAIATAFKVTDTEWLDLLVAWLKTEAGYDARKLWIEPKDSSVSALRDIDAGQVARATMLFSELTHADRIEITKAMQRSEVRACLPAINRVWEKFAKTAPKADSPNKGHGDTQALHKGAVAAIQKDVEQKNTPPT